MSAELKRLTTEYVETEDRIRLSGELPDDQTVVLWLTQRLLNRLILPLTQWLENPEASAAASALNRPAPREAVQEVMQGFAQQAARAQLIPEPPVRATAPVASWRVDTVDIHRGQAAVQLTFRDAGDQAATVKLAARPLRQWLGIVHDQYVKGEWPTILWPEWMHAPPPQIEARAAALH